MKIVVLTGAGVSAESGVATFRDAGGVWAKYDYREVATPEGFDRNPALVHEFYNARRRGLESVFPNPAHEALVTLERGLAAKGGALTLVTQNVDDLHERAGSQNIIHMHGELLRAVCGACGAGFDWTEDISVETACPACSARGAMRPDIVWFGEMPKHMEAIAVALDQADMFVAIGTSGAVYPAAGFVHEARAAGLPCVELNLEPSDNADAFSEARYGKAGEVTPAFVNELLGR